MLRRTSLIHYRFFFLESAFAFFLLPECGLAMPSGQVSLPETKDLNWFEIQNFTRQ